MKIAIFCDTYTPYINGVVTHIKILREGLIALGHEVLIVTAETTTKKHYIENGVLRCPAKALKRIYGYGVINPYNRKAMRILREFDPDIIHAQQEFSVGFFAIRVAKALDKPLVYTLHTMYDDYVFYVAPKFFIPAATRIAHSYCRYISNNASAIISCSNKAVSFFKSCRVTKPVNIIPNSVEVEAFDPERFDKDIIHNTRKELGIADDATVCIFVGRLGKEKSIHVLLDYWAEHLKNEEKLHLVVVGDGPEYQNLIDQSKNLGIDKHVTFTGKIPHEKIMPIYLASDIYVSASLSEMMSISMLEGMAAGLPIVQRYDELNASQIQEGVNGYNYHTPLEMKKYIMDIANLTKEEKAALRKRVRGSVKEAGAERSARKMLEIYEQVLNEKNEVKYSKEIV